MFSFISFYHKIQLKHEDANRLYWDSTKKEELFISLLCLQETGFVLHKLAQQPEMIEKTLVSFLHYQPVAYDIQHFKRAVEIARQIGFQNINDCLHTAIAEEHCDELYTYNKADFKRIKTYTRLKITIL